MHKYQNEKTSNKIISLIGMPGCGKSTIGKNVAEKLGCKFLDSDEIIESRAGCSIPDIFKKEGEKTFRSLEAEVILHILDAEKGNVILSTGGGAIMTPDIEKNLMEKSYVVFLNTSLETLWKHVESSYVNRPLLAQDGDPQKKLEDLLNHRLPVYSKAHLVINCDGMSLPDVSKALMQKIEQI